MEQMLDSKERIRAIELDEGSIIKRAPEVERERATAIADLLDNNSFAPTVSSNRLFEHFGIDICQWFVEKLCGHVGRY